MSACEGKPLDIAPLDCRVDAFAIVGIATEIGIEPTVRQGCSRLLENPAKGALVFSVPIPVVHVDDVEIARDHEVAYVASLLSGCFVYANLKACRLPNNRCLSSRRRRSHGHGNTDPSKQ